jgi:hypothetical protein
VLNGPVSDRWAAVETNAFLSRLAPEQPETESYLLSLMEPLATMTETLSPVGLAPSVLERLADRLQAARRTHPALQDLSLLEQTETALRRRVALLYAYAGAIDLALEQVVPPDSLRPALDLPSGPDTPPRSRLAAAQTTARSRQESRVLEWLADHWALGPPSADQDTQHQTWVPVVERLPSWAEGTSAQASRRRPPSIGALRQIALQLRRVDDADNGPAQDQLWTDLSSNEDREDTTSAPVAAARALLNHRRPALQGYPMEGRLLFNWSHLGHEGRSAGLAIASLFYAAALDAAHQRHRLRVRPEVTFTGALSPKEKASADAAPADGSVRPVSEQGLDTKVETAFFSPKTTLAVPEAQVEAAKHHRDALYNAFPHGRLDIIGVSELRDVIDHRRLTEHTEEGRLRHTARRLWSRRGAVAGGAVIAVLLMAVGLLLYGPLDKNPTTVDLEGEQIIAKNSNGAVVERIRVGERIVNWWNDPQNNFHGVDLYDVTGNGRNEICWAQNDGPSDPSDFVACQEVGAEEPLWQFPLHLSVSFPNKPAVTPEDYMAHGLTVGDLNADDRPEVYITTTHQPYFPSILLQLDATTGTEMGRYVHPGYADIGPHAIDLENDGIQEILIGGHTNAYHQAAFIVLDPRHIRGHGPVTPEYQVTGHAPAAERTYVRIPRTKVGKAQDSFITVSDINFRDEGRIEVQVEEGFLEVNQGRYKPDFRLYLDRSLRPQAVGTSSRHDQLADSLVQRNRIETLPDAEYFQDFQTRLKYWTGSGWSSEPTTNARWREAVATDSSAQKRNSEN